MNLQEIEFMAPLKVMMINPLIPASQLTIAKILSGKVFGKKQFIDLILLVYANEINQAEGLAQELTACAFPGFNTISVTSDLPRITDADVFCFMTTFANPNSFDFENMDSCEVFDNVYLIIKIATSLAKPVIVEEPTASPTEKAKKPEKPIRRPIIVGDGLLVIDILKIIAKTLPHDMLFFITPLRTIAEKVLGDYLKVRCIDINHCYVWAANDLVFHTEISEPYLVDDKVDQETQCVWAGISLEKMEELNLEHINFNASWMKEEFIERIVLSSSNNPYGCIFKAAEMAITLRDIWKPRCVEENIEKINISLGVISDGSIGTIRGLPYVLPVYISEYSWSADQKYEETSHLRHEIKRINKAALAHHQKLVSYCNNFLEENIIKKSFIPVSLETKSDLISEGSSSYSSVNPEK